MVRRREDFTDKVAGIITLFFHDPLPDGRRRTGIIAGTSDIPEGQVVRFPFGSPVDMDRLDLIADRVEDEVVQALAADRIGQDHLADFDIDLLLRRIGDVVFLAVAHFMA